MVKETKRSCRGAWERKIQERDGFLEGDAMEMQALMHSLRLRKVLQPGSDGIPVPDPSRTFFQVPDPKIENDWVPGN